jgi:4,5-dihydroxyphthalate decarboxylase
VFPSSVFRHSAIYLPARSRIGKPEDLKGARVGVGDYQMTAAVWVRELLAHEYGVLPGDIEWVTRRPVRAVRKPEGVRIMAMPGDTTLEGMLERGEIDALASVMIPKGLGTSVRRLFADFRAVETAYFKKTGIFPIMHTFVLKTALYEKNPWLATSFYRAFCRARDRAYRTIYDTDALAVGLPWVIDEMEMAHKIFGPRIWDYSIEGSRPTLEALVAAVHEQGLASRRVSVEELFAPNIGPGLAEYLRSTGED